MKIFEILSCTSNKYMYVVVIQKTKKFTFIVVLNQKALEIRQMIDMYLVWLLEHYRYINMKTILFRRKTCLSVRPPLDQNPAPLLDEGRILAV